MVAIGEWHRGPVIGRGASATVSIATDQHTSSVFAVKSVEISRAGVLQREQSILSALRSPHVVSCLGADTSVTTSDGSRRYYYNLFLEYAPGGSLADDIKRRGGRCEEPLIRSRAADVLRGLAYVHGAGVAHCDVKARNVLIGRDGRAMLADFGCARVVDNNAGGGRMVIRGTPMLMSPEAARGEAQEAAADIWALGCTVIEMATGGTPWRERRFVDPVAALHHIAHSGDVPDHPGWMSEEAKDFLSRCLVRDPTKRWTAEQLLQHPFIAAAAASSVPVDPACSAKAEVRVSPKSVLDQLAFWDDDSDSDTSTVAALMPAERVRALAHDVAADWTWSGGEQWITVCAQTNSNGTAASAGLEADAGRSSARVSEEQIGDHHGSSAAHGDADASPGSGCCSSLSPCNRVISGSNNGCCCCSNSSSNFASTTRNKRCCCSVVNDAGLVTFRLSWQPLTTFQRAAEFLPFGECRQLQPITCISSSPRVVREKKKFRVDNERPACRRGRTEILSIVFAVDFGPGV